MSENGGESPQREQQRVIYGELLFETASSTMALGLNLAFYRSFAAPRIARRLAQTRVILDQPVQRASDTAVLVWEMVMNGFEQERGRAALRRMNHIHQGFSIPPEDFAYVLATLAVVPMQTMDRYGWRRTTEVERAAAAGFYAELGRHMGLRDLPGDYAGFEAFMLDYERRCFAYTDEARDLVAATLSLLGHRVPRPLRGAVGLLGSTLMSPSMRTAAGVRTPPSGLTSLVRVAARARARRAHRRDPHPGHRFPDGVVVLPAYPDGYALEQIGHPAAAARA